MQQPSRHTVMVARGHARAPLLAFVTASCPAALTARERPAHLLVRRRRAGGDAVTAAMSWGERRPHEAQGVRRSRVKARRRRAPRRAGRRHCAPQARSRMTAARVPKSSNSFDANAPQRRRGWRPRRSTSRLRPSTSAADRVSFTDQHERRVSRIGARLCRAPCSTGGVTQSDDGGKAAADGTTKSERKLKRSSTMTQAKFAARMASKDAPQAQAKDRWLVATGVSGLVVLIVHDTILITLPAVYPHVGFFLRAAMTVNCAVLVGQLCVARRAGIAQFGAPPRPRRGTTTTRCSSARSRRCRRTSRTSSRTRCLQPLPRRGDDRRVATCRPPATRCRWTQRGDCRMGGYGAPPERDLSPYCYNVYTSYVGLFMFARLCDGTRLHAARRQPNAPRLPPDPLQVPVHAHRDVSSGSSALCQSGQPRGASRGRHRLADGPSGTSTHPVRCLMAFVGVGRRARLRRIVEVQQERPGDCSAR